MNISDILFVDLVGSTSYNTFKRKGLNVFPPYKDLSRFAFKFRYLQHKLNFYRFDVCSDINNDILNQDPKMIVVIGSLIYEPFLKKLRKRFPQIPIKFFYSNIVKSKASLSPAVLSKYGIEGYSWDKNDALSYSLNYTKPLFDLKIMPVEENIKYDVCFIGADKGRYKTIKYLKTIFERLKLNVYIRVTADFKFLKYTHSYYSDPIPYDEYLRVVASSKCIIDLVQDGQTGTTMRVMEAIFSNKKLISNNIHLAECDFYHPDNIFILGKDDINSIQEFLMKNIKPVDKNVLFEYTIDYWLDKLISDK